jgi:hypothetical protein
MRDALIKSAVGTLKAAADLMPCTKGAGLLSLLFCSVEGTLVETADGPMPIEQIEVGMWVRATDCHSQRGSGPLLRVVMGQVAWCGVRGGYCGGEVAIAAVRCRELG